MMLVHTLFVFFFPVFVVGSVIAIVLLLSNRKTRKAALLALLVAPLLLIAAVFWWRVPIYRGSLASAYVEPIEQIEPMSAVRLKPEPNPLSAGRLKTEHNGTVTIATAAAATAPQAPQAPQVPQTPQGPQAGTADAVVNPLTGQQSPQVLQAPQGPQVPQAPQGPQAEAEDVKGEAAAVEKPADAEAKKNDRPAWVDASPGLVDNAYEMAVAVGPYTSVEECEAEVPAAIRLAVAHYIEVCQGQPAPRYAQWWDEAFCRNLIKSRWEEITQHSIGPMRQLHLLLEFDQHDKQRILAGLKQAVIHRRLSYAGVGAAGMLGSLGLLFCFLKMTAGGGRGEGRKGKGEGEKREG